MFRSAAIPLALLLLAANASSLLAKDVAGSKDHPQIGRYVGSEIQSFAVKDFDEVRLVKAPLTGDMLSHRFNDTDSVKLEGKVTSIRYNGPKGRSTLEIQRNYEQSLKQKGFEIVFVCADQDCFARRSSPGFVFGALVDSEREHWRYEHSARYFLAKRASPSGDTWAGIIIGEKNAETSVFVRAVDVKPMEDGLIRFIDASAMEKAVLSQGRVALYGIEFDTDKADIRPSSEPTLVEMVKFLRNAPQLSVIIAGHTDNQGDFNYNVSLSQRRAAALVAALRARGISESRLIPFGAGMAAPLADNADEQGRAKNRRVEMVKR